MKEKDKEKEPVQVEDNEQRSKNQSFVCTIPIEDCVAVHDGDCSRCPLF